jgi:hypothetical protein
MYRQARRQPRIHIHIQNSQFSIQQFSSTYNPSLSSSAWQEAQSRFHALADYVGEYQHPAYGVLKMGMKDGQLQFDFRKIRLPLTRFHYDRTDTPDDEI